VLDRRAAPSPRAHSSKGPNCKTMTTWQYPEALQQLKALAFEMDVPQQALISEALNLLFRKDHKPTIAG
jgi:Antitoxin-like ribbon-helix-helix